MTLYRIETKVNGMRETFVDWYWAEHKADALKQNKADCEHFGVPVDRSTFDIREATETELKAIKP